MGKNLFYYLAVLAVVIMLLQNVGWLEIPYGTAWLMSFVVLIFVLLTWFADRPKAVS